jgi:hypothetical protein
MVVVGLTTAAGLVVCASSDASGTVAASAERPSAVADLQGVSCVFGRFCIAVGRTDSFSGPAAAVVWNGHKWRRVAVPEPSAARYSELSGISCT